MARILLNLDDLRNQELENLVRIEKKNKSQIIREAIDLILSTRNISETDKLNKFFGAWKKKNIDGLKFQQQIRDEWDR